jgi:ribosomal protein L34
MRRSLALAILLIAAGCGRAEEEQRAATLEEDGRIDCRIAADDQFHRFCRLERERTEQGMLITVRKPDGGFRRLIATRDGRGVVAADGAEQAEVRIVGENLIEVALAGDSFRLPARIGPVPRPAQ